MTLVCALGSTLLLTAPSIAFAQNDKSTKHDQADKNKDKEKDKDKGKDKDENGGVTPNAATPEGSSLLLVGAGLVPLAAVYLWQRRRRR